VTPKRLFLYTLIASVVVSGVLGILALLVGSFGWYEERVVLTTLTISLVSLLAMGCEAGLGRPWAWVSWLGISLAVLDGAVTILGMWAIPDWTRFWKASATLTVWAVVCVHLTLLGLRKLSARYRWSRSTAIVAVVFLGLLITAAIFSDGAGPLMTTIGIVAIAAVVNGILVVIFERLSRGEAPPQAQRPRADVVSIEAEIERLKARLEELEELRRRA
jgi:hypothetical protein